MQVSLEATQLCPNCGAKVTARRLDEESPRQIGGVMIEIDGQPLFLAPGSTVLVDLDPAYALQATEKEFAKIIPVLRLHRCSRRR